MSFVALWIGVLIFGLGAIFSLLSAIRTLQTSRRWSDYRLRRRYIVQARGSVLLSVLSAALAVALLVFGRLAEPAARPAALPPTETPQASETVSPVPPGLPTETPIPAADTPTAVVITPSPIIPPTIARTPTPAMPIAVQAMIQGTVTPAFEVQFGRLRFSTDINNYTLVAPGEKFRNPIKQMYSVFTYQPIGVKIEWTALWYQNGELKHVDTTSWKEFPPGVAVVSWLRPAPEWEAGEYEVQVFVGTDWEASGRFALDGAPPTVTASSSPTATSPASPTATLSSTPTITLTPTASPLPPPTKTPVPSATLAPTSTPRPTPTATTVPTSTNTPAPSSTPLPTRTSTRAPTSTPVPSSTSTHVPRVAVAATATRTVSPTASPTAVPSATRTPTPTMTRTATPTATRTATPTASPTASPRPTQTPLPTATRTNTATPRPTFTATSTATWTPRPSASPVPSSTPTKTPSSTPSPTSSPTITPTPLPVKVDIYFTNTRASGTGSAPHDQAVRREIPGSANMIAAALDAYFTGPTIEEQSQGLMAPRNGFVSYRKLEFTNGVLSVYLAGNCEPTGTGYSIAQPLIATLRQFPGVLHVKIYDAYDHTGDALSAADSWPACLDVIFTSTPTALPTRTPTATSSLTPTASPIPTRTPIPPSTPTPPPTRTPLPTATSSPLPTRTPLPTATSTPLPTRTPIPTTTRTALPTRTPLPMATLPPTRTPTSPPTATRTRTPAATFTPAPTNTPRPTLTLTPINAPTRTIIAVSQASPTPRVTTGPASTLDAVCNRAEFLGDVTIVDNATLRPGEAFRKTWRIQNAGNCPWTAAYKLVYVRGDQMGGPASVPLPSSVLPGQSADVFIDLVAPAEPGQYQGFWQLQTPNRTTFGIGPAATGNLWVQIRVGGPALPTATTSDVSPSPATVQPTGWAEATLTAFVSTETAQAASATPSSTQRSLATPAEVADFAGDACLAQWQANDGILDCPSADSDPRGAVSVLSQASLEDGTTVTRSTLLTVPSTSKDGYILGLYPRYQVQAGDRFQALVGCELDAEQCSVLFRISYLDSTGAAHDLWTLGEFYDGHYYDLDLDLSDLAGQQIRLVLSVDDLGSSASDRALWVAPRIVRLPEPASTALPARSSTPAATSTLARAPTSTIVVSPPTDAPIETPTAPIPQFFDSVLNFIRQLFGAP